MGRGREGFPSISLGRRWGPGTGGQARPSWGVRVIVPPKVAEDKKHHVLADSPPFIFFKGLLYDLLNINQINEFISINLFLKLFLSVGVSGENVLNARFKFWVIVWALFCDVLVS